MKRILATLLLMAAVACQSRTDFGECVGAFDDREPNLKYKVSTRNLVLSVIFFETIFVPAVVIVNETACPVGDIKSE
jgi:hypothetical protein